VINLIYRILGYPYHAKTIMHSIISKHYLIIILSVIIGKFTPVEE